MKLAASRDAALFHATFAGWHWTCSDEIRTRQYEANINAVKQASEADAKAAEERVREFQERLDAAEVTAKNMEVQESQRKLNEQEHKREIDSKIKEEARKDEEAAAKDMQIREFQRMLKRESDEREAVEKANKEEVARKDEEAALKLRKAEEAKLQVEERVWELQVRFDAAEAAAKEKMDFQESQRKLNEQEYKREID